MRGPKMMPTSAFPIGETNKIALASIIARAADEIEELRWENDTLKAKIKK